MEEVSESSADVFGVFLDKLTPQARRYVLRWLESPWTLGELLEGPPQRETGLHKRRGGGVLRFSCGAPEENGWDLQAREGVRITW